MLKKIILGCLLLNIQNIFASDEVNFHHTPFEKSKLSSLIVNSRLMLKQNHSMTSLHPVGKIKINKDEFTRYQQFYQNIPVVGAQVVIRKSFKLGNNEVNGKFFNDINLNTKPSLSKAEILKKLNFVNSKLEQQLPVKIQLQIRKNKNNELQLVYLASVKGLSTTKKPQWLFYVIDANTGDILKQWNNIQHFSDSGPGGNELVHEYWYGKDGLPSLDVSQQGNNCVLQDDKVQVVNLHSSWEYSEKDRKGIDYLCLNNIEDYTHGAYSPANDAYFFGHTIINLFKNWYNLTPLQDENGTSLPLIMQVHFGENFDNAFWDGEVLTFGDGFYFYPLISLEIAAHEVAHGFTQSHSQLEYHDESGALNESFSDMAGIAALAYLLEKNPETYNKISLSKNSISWKIGETIIGPFLQNKIDAIRYVNRPSIDGESADCVDKKLARLSKSFCAISYNEIVANLSSLSEEEKQSALVHTGSGVFNRAFYLLSDEYGIKKAFNIMLMANIKYWTPNVDFQQAACDVIDAAHDLGENVNITQSVFKRVGIDTSLCNSKL